MNKQPWQPPQQPPPGVVNIKELIEMHAYFSQVKEPNDTVKQILAYFETIFLAFAQSLSPGAPRQ